MIKDQKISHPDCPKGILERLEIVDVKFYSDNNEVNSGQIIVDKELVQDITELFEMIFNFPADERFPITSVIPIANFGWDDESSMAQNNTSGFNYRKIEGQDKLSLHSYGFAIDLNPKINPVILNGKVTQPRSGSYNVEVPGTLFANHPIVEFMKAKGWEWGGDWTRYQDYQHFQKKVY